MIWEACDRSIIRDQDKERNQKLAEESQEAEPVVTGEQDHEPVFTGSDQTKD